MNVCGRGYVYCRQSASILVGLCVGITLSLLLTPFLEEDCYLLEGRSSSGSVLHLSSSQSRSLRSQQMKNVDNYADDDFQPRITLKAKQKKVTNVMKKINRPRLYSVELGMKEKLLICVLSTKNSLSTFGVALNATLTHHVSRVVFFVDASDRKQVPHPLPSMTVIGFDGGRTLLQPFHILRYLGEHYVREFDFFFLVKDTSFVRSWTLNELVSHMSVSEMGYVGQKKSSDALYCSLDAGILLSRTALLPILTHLDWCARNAFSDEMDDNLGRCVLHSTNVPCREDVQGQKFVSNRFPRSAKGNLNSLAKSDRISEALTVSSVDEPASMYRLNKMFSQLEVTKMQGQIKDLQMRIDELRLKEPDSGKNDSGWPIGAFLPFEAKNRFDVLNWQYFTQRDIYLDSDFYSSHRLSGNNLEDVQLVVNATVATVLKNQKKLKFDRVINGYRRFDPTRGMEYVIDVAFQDKAGGREVHKRLEVVRPLGKVEAIAVPYVTETTRVTFLLRIDVNNRQQLARFLDQYTRVCLQSQDNTALIAVFIYDPRTAISKEDIFGNGKTLINTYAKKFRSRSIRLSWISIRSPGLRPSELGILDLVVRKFADTDPLLLICQPEMEIKLEYLNCVRMNTIRHSQVFAPIPFVQYHPDIIYKKKPAPPTSIEVNKNYGHFETHSYEHMSFYASDYLIARKLVNSEVPVVRLEKDLRDIKHQRLPYGLYQMFVKTRTVHVLRAVEPALVVRFKLRTCVSTLTEDAHRACVKRREESLASRSQLAELIFEQKRRAKSLANKNVPLLRNESVDLR